MFPFVPPFSLLRFFTMSFYNLSLFHPRRLFCSLHFVFFTPQCAPFKNTEKERRYQEGHADINQSLLSILQWIQIYFFFKSKLNPNLKHFWKLAKSWICCQFPFCVLEMRNPDLGRPNFKGERCAELAVSPRLTLSPSLFPPPSTLFPCVLLFYLLLFHTTSVPLLFPPSNLFPYYYSSRVFFDVKFFSWGTNEKRVRERSTPTLPLPLHL